MQRNRNRTLNGLSLCSGAGGLEFGLKIALLDYRTVCYVERDSYAAAVLVARMEDQALDLAPVWDDVATFDGRPWRGIVDIVTAGYPCQPFSTAGRRLGADDDRHLWPHVARIIREVRPRFVFLENVANHLTLGFEDVYSELSGMGFRVAAGLYTAAEAGAPHERKRLFVLAYAGCQCQHGLQSEPVAECRCAAAPGSIGEGLADAECITGSAGPERSRWQARADADRRGPWADVANPSIDGSGQLSDRSGVRQATVDTVGRGCVVGHAGGDIGVQRRAGQRREAEAREAVRAVGVPHSAGSQGFERWDLASEGTAWPPGPDDADGWERYLKIRPGTEPAVRRGSDGLAWRVERLRLAGNGVVPVVAAVAFVDLWRQLGE